MTNFNKKRVSYFYDEEIGSFYYAPKHPMKPHRIAVTHDLVLGYELHKQMEIYKPKRSSKEELQRFHTKKYVNFLQSIIPTNQDQFIEQQSTFNVGEDCPIFDNMFELFQISAGGSIQGAVKLNHNLADISINWAGGLHHAKKSRASGFCYINDIVLAILELLKFFPRVLYIDIDIHHGDGVEEAFYATDRVMTCSFHKYGDEFFPGTGNLRDTGVDVGKYYSVNFPLLNGITNEKYLKYFKLTIDKILEVYRPSAIVLQCGADSLYGDRLGSFNLDIKGHGECVKYIRNKNLPLLVLGGGGYTPKNVAKCWAYETGILVGQNNLNDQLPETVYSSYFGENNHLYTLDSKTDFKDQNTKRRLESTYQQICENLRIIKGAPSIQMKVIPNEFIIQDSTKEDLENDQDKNPDSRITSSPINRNKVDYNKFKEDGFFTKGVSFLNTESKINRCFALLNEESFQQKCLKRIQKPQFFQQCEKEIPQSKEYSNFFNKGIKQFSNSLPMESTYSSSHYSSPLSSNSFSTSSSVNIFKKRRVNNITVVGCKNF
ncbi:histone deacetylase hos2-related [Anaeramoeba flamelloides]|uniref:histone deacetylase n=1 Tax=Anaeramoeba flamelloides TaxID=1746091 RepID=A0ABQ8YWV1_9EUKA|nr:histone deacetylase hos2-related [Anaeramoeba flamelloides]